MIKGNEVREVSLNEQDVGAKPRSIDVIQLCRVDEVCESVNDE